MSQDRLALRYAEAPDGVEYDCAPLAPGWILTYRELKAYMVGFAHGSSVLTESVQRHANQGDDLESVIKLLVRLDAEYKKYLRSKGVEP